MRHKYYHKIFAAILLLLFAAVQETQPSEIDPTYGVNKVAKPQR